MEKLEKKASIILWACVITLSLFYFGYELGKDYFSFAN